MLQQIANALEASPMYNLSLSSKELFHSNFLAWLGNNKSTKQFFVNVINELVEELNLQPSGDWIVKREDDHFDLSIKENGDKGKYLLVIENKVKSLPQKKQLNDYRSKNIKGKDDGTKFLLLTLVDRYPNKPIEGWEKKTYENLACIMHAQDKTTIIDKYERSLIEDYIIFIKNLNNLVKEWNSETVFAQKMSVDLPKLQDLHVKLQFGRYCKELRKKIREIRNDVVVYDDNDIPEDADIVNSKVYVKVYWEYASKGQEGILDVEIPVFSLDDPHIIMGLNKDDKGNPMVPFNIKIQVEGHEYRHVIETNTDIKGDKPLGEDLVKIGKNHPYTDNLSFDFFIDDPSKSTWDSPKYESVYNKDKSIFVFPKLHPVRKTNMWPFKSYSDKKEVNFIYQSRMIKDNIRIDLVLNNIVDEVERILNLFP